MYDIPATPSSTTPVAEVFEQLNGTLLDCWRRIAGLVQDDIDSAASGSMRLEDLVSCGPRLARAGLDNLYELAAAFSDNLSILRSTPLTRDQAAVVTTTVPIAVPANRGVKIVATKLTSDGGALASIKRLSFKPDACDKQRKGRRELIEVTLSTSGLAGGTYTGVLCVRSDADGATLHEASFLLPVADLE